MENQAQKTPRTLHKADAKDATVSFAGNHRAGKLFESFTGELD